MILNRMLRVVLIAGFVSLFTATGVFAMENIPTAAENKENLSAGLKAGEEALSLFREGKGKEAFQKTKVASNFLDEISGEALNAALGPAMTDLRYAGYAARNSARTDKGEEYTKEQSDKAGNLFQKSLSHISNIANEMAKE